MKEYKVNIKCYKEITIYVNAKNKKQVLKMVKDVITKSNLIDKVSSEEEQYLYKVEEQQDGKE